MSYRRHLNVKFVNVKEAKETYQYSKTKEELHKTNAAIWYNENSEKREKNTCMTYTIAVFTVKNSWWRTEELSEACRVLFQK